MQNMKTRNPAVSMSDYSIVHGELQLVKNKFINPKVSGKVDDNIYSSKESTEGGKRNEDRSIFTDPTDVWCFQTGQQSCISQRRRF